MAKKKKPSPLAKALLETAGDMRKAGTVGPCQPREDHAAPSWGCGQDHGRADYGTAIRAMRERAKLSQAVFAHYLNLTVGYVSQLERGAKQPTGAALALLNVIKRKGIEAIL